MKKNKDPFPITNVYLMGINSVDRATVSVGDVCENLTNDFDIEGGFLNCKNEDMISELKKINSSKKNSISFGNSCDGDYPVWVGVDKKNKIRKIFATASASFEKTLFDSFSRYSEKTKSYFTDPFEKKIINDNFFDILQKKRTEKKRIKLFNLKTESGLIGVSDVCGSLDYDHIEKRDKVLDKKFFKKKDIYKNNNPLKLLKFTYSLVTKSYSSSFASSSIHQKKKESYQNQINTNYTEFLSYHLDENCYPIKYIFEDYLDVDVQKGRYVQKHIIIKKNIKISSKYLSKRLPVALNILKKQTKKLFKDSFEEVFKIRKKQFEDFVNTIIKDIDADELNLPTPNKKENIKIFSEKKLSVEGGDSNAFDGFKFKNQMPFDYSPLIFSLQKGSYPVYLHFSVTEEDGEEHENVKIVIEGIEGCYLNKNKQGALCTERIFKKSSHIINAINKKLKSLAVDMIDLRNSSSLKEIEKLTFVEELILVGLDNITNWNSLSKLKSLKKLKLIECNISSKSINNFFKNLYLLKNLEKVLIDGKNIKVKSIKTQSIKTQSTKIH